MPPARSVKAGVRSGVRNAKPMQDDDEDGSQGLLAPEMVRIAQEMVDNSKKRREQKRKTIENEYHKDLEQFRSEIESYYTARQVMINKKQNEKWDRLERLSREKADIEAQILHRIKTVQASALQLSNELNAAIEDRQEALSTEAIEDDLVKEKTNGAINKMNQTTAAYCEV